MGRKIKQKKISVPRLIVYSLIWVALLVSLIFSSTFEKYINRKDFNYNQDFSQATYKVHFVDVGQGDCAVIELPDNKVFMIDAGPKTAENNVVRYLNSLNITTIDYFLMTHPDEDHVGSAKRVFDDFNIKNVYIPKAYSPRNDGGFRASSVTKTWQGVQTAMLNEGCEILYSAPNVMLEGPDYKIFFYGPLDEEYNDTNSYSPIVMFTICQTKYLFTGDVPTKVENKFCATYKSEIDNNLLDCNVLKVAHHGSSGSSSEKFLEAVKPELAIISVNHAEYKYHPAQATLDRLTAVGADIMRTDDKGSIVLSGVNGNIISADGYANFGAYIEYEYIVVAGGIFLVMAWGAVLVKTNEPRINKGKKKSK